jgi:hypothetical protein
MTRLLPSALVAAALGGAAALPAAADEFTAAMQAFYEAELAALAQDPVLAGAIAAQNARTSGLPQSEIDALDSAWRAEVGAADTPTITPVLENDAAAMLRERVAASGGTITEIFAVDERGLNVAASAVTSDYWQGDEAKFTETFPVGAGAVHFGEVEFDESTQTFQGQISFTVSDPATGAPIGAVTVGVDAESLL